MLWADLMFPRGVAAIPRALRARGVTAEGSVNQNWTNSS